MRKKASKNLFSFFVANRDYGWFWLGTSMVATTFSADTPLAIAGITANQGIGGNWFWWSWVFTYMTIAIFYSKLWWRSGIITDAEFTEIRYSGKSAGVLRFLKAFYFSIFLNGIILGWIFLSLQKILIPFLNPDFSSFLLFDNDPKTLVLITLVVIVIVYSSLSGVRAGVFNDMFQFIIAMGGSILFSYLAVQYVGGISSLKEKLIQLYGNQSDLYTNFFPDWKDMGYILLIYFFVQWWAQYYSDGTGYLVQRMNTAKTEKDAQLGALWFTFANFSIRTWPWVLIGLVGLILFPVNSDACNQKMGEWICRDREMAYPVLIQILFESIPGMRGFLLLGLIAAFMSTVETHLNWGASYIANDLYKRYIRPHASGWELLMISKMGIFFMALIGFFFASYMDSISSAWKFLIAISAGIGLPQMLRWFWWRVNAWTEIGGIVVSLVLAWLLYWSGNFDTIPQEYFLFLIAVSGAFFSLVLTLLTKPTNLEQLKQFVQKVQPYGFWKPIMGKNLIKPLVIDIALWLLGNLSILTFMLSIGYLVFEDYTNFILFLFFSVLSGFPVILFLIHKRE